MNNATNRSPHAGNARWAPSGFEYPPRSVAHSAAYQTERLTAADVDPALYGDQYEAGLFGLDCFDSMVASGLDIDGYVFFSQVYRQLRPSKVGEPLTVTGWVRDLHKVRKGHSVTELYRLTDGEGRVCIETELTGLLADPPGQTPQDSGDAPPMPRRAELPADGWTLLREKQVTPDKVRVFSQDVGNEIHFDVEFARRHGFRAPLAQGIMSAVWLLAVLADERPPTAFDVEVRYLRPVFWDSRASLWVRRSADGALEMAQSRNEEGKVTADMRVKSLSYDPVSYGPVPSQAPAGG